ncbi:hypothetical protein ACWDOP_03640 [Nocardia sp. NPDC003693]
MVFGHHGPGHPVRMNPETGPGDTLGESESLDSDEVRNEDGDAVVTPPDHWQAADRDDMTTRGQQLGESHAERLAAEEPDQQPYEESDPPRDGLSLDSANSEADDPDRPVRRHRGQVSSTPEDGDPFYSELD